MTQYILSLSYGKDSLACLGAIEKLGLPLDRIVHAEVWATDTIPADLPPMVEFKKKADAIIKDRYGIEVEHICAMKRERERESFERQFYSKFNSGNHTGEIYGFPIVRGSWCKDRLKTSVLSGSIPQKRVAKTRDPLVQRDTKEAVFSKSSIVQGADTNIVHYLGIASDEPERIQRHKKSGIELPLVQIGWDEAYCRQWCEENDLLSPIYTGSTRGGCWFCHMQSVGQLRLLYKNYPEYWQLLLKWDKDSPTSFKPEGITVHDFDKRFKMEDDGLIDPNRRFLWSMVK